MYSFAGGGLPPNIGTMAIAPFDNQTTSPDLPKELYDQMRHRAAKAARRSRCAAGTRRRAGARNDCVVRCRRSGELQRQPAAGRDCAAPLASHHRSRDHRSVERSRALPEQVVARRGRLRRTRRGGRARSRRSRRSCRRSSRECRAIGEATAWGRRPWDACSVFSSLSAIVYFGVNIGRVYWRFYQYQDDMRQEVRFASQRTNDQILTHLKASADSLGLPEGAAKISIRRTEKSIAIESDTTRTSKCRCTCARCTSIRTPKARLERGVRSAR